MKRSLLFRALYTIIWVFFHPIHRGKNIGLSNIPEGAALLCSNHTRNSDPLMILFALGFKSGLHIMAKEEMRRWPVAGFLLDRIGILIWVKRGKADIGAVKSSLKTLKDGQKLLIFPEGTRHEEVGAGKTGAAMMAIRAGVPIVPVFLPAKKKWFRATPIVFGEAYMPFTEDRKPTPEDYQQVTEDLMGRIAALEARLT